MALPSAFRKTEVVAVQHVMEQTEKPITPDGMEIRHLLQKIDIPGRPYRESPTVQDASVPDSVKLGGRGGINTKAPGTTYRSPPESCSPG
jgi:hypothetical protein